MTREHSSRLKTCLSAQKQQGKEEERKNAFWWWRDRRFEHPAGEHLGSMRSGNHV